MIGADGHEIAHASIEVWQPDENGFYDLQKLDPSVAAASTAIKLAAIISVRSNLPDTRFRWTVRWATWSAPRGRQGWRRTHIRYLVGAGIPQASPRSIWLTTSTSLDYRIRHRTNPDHGAVSEQSRLAVRITSSIHFNFKLAAIHDAASRPSARILRNS